MASYTKDNAVTHAGVKVNNWAGEYECSVCRRKRLTASEFSKKMQERFRAEGNGKLKCKACVEQAAQAERDAAAKKAEKAGAAAAAAAPGDGGETATCSACKKALPVSAFTKPQLKKGPAKQRCGPCVAAADASEKKAGDDKKTAALADARRDLAKAEASGDATAKLKAASKLSALEGELVTGLKPLKLGRGRGRGRGRLGRGRGRS